MNKLSKIALSTLCIMALFLLPVTYANSKVITSALLNGEEVSSAEAGEIVTVRAQVDKAHEGDSVTFVSNNEALAFIDPETGNEVDGTIEKEVSLNGDGTGVAEVSAKSKSSEQFDLDATLRDEPTEDAESQSSDESNPEENSEAAKTDSEENTNAEKTGAADEESSKAQEDSTGAKTDNTNSESTALDQSKTDEEDKDVSGSKSETSQDKNGTNTSSQAEEVLTINTDTKTALPKDTVKVNALLTPETEDSSVLENVNWKISYSGKEITPTNPTGTATSFEVPDDVEDTITVSATLPEENSPSGKEIVAQEVTIPAGAQTQTGDQNGSTTTQENSQNKTNEEKSTTESSTTENTANTENNATGAQSKSIDIYPSTDSKTVPVGTDIGFSSEILEGEYVADDTVKEDVRYTWFAQLDNVYLNGTSFGSTYSVRPTEPGELQVWVTATLKDGTELKSDPIVKTIVNEGETDSTEKNSEEKDSEKKDTTQSDDTNDALTSSALKITPVPKNKMSAKPGEKITFTRDRSEELGIDEEGAKFAWIAKMGDETVGEQKTKANFTTSSENEGTLIVTLTITPKDGEAIVSEPLKIEITDNPDEKVQMIPENMEPTESDKTDESTDQTDSSKEKTDESESKETTDKSKETSTENSSKDTSEKDSTSKPQSDTTSNTNKSQSDSTSEKSKDKKTSSSTENPVNQNVLKLTGAEITTKTDTNNVHVGDNVILDADITTAGGSGEVSYKWEAKDSKGNVIATSQKLNHFEIKPTEAGDVTVSFEVSSKDPNSPEAYKVAKAEKVITFNNQGDEREAVAAKIDGENNLKADNLQEKAKSGDNKATSSGTSSTSSTKGSSSSSKGTSSGSKNSSKGTSSGSSSSNKATSSKGSTSTKSSNPSKNTSNSGTTKNDSSTKGTTKSQIPNTNSGTDNKVASNNTKNEKTTPLSSTKPKSSLGADINKGVNSVLAKPTGIINPTNGKSFSVGQIGAAVLTALGIGVVAYFLVRHKRKLDEDSTNYYL